MQPNFPFEQVAPRLPKGNWQMPVDAETWRRRLQKVPLHGSDCIIRVMAPAWLTVETATLLCMYA